MGKGKGTKSTTSTKSTSEKESAEDTQNVVEQMIQGKAFIVEGGVFKDIGSLTPETQATSISKILTEKRVMF
jgi:hypothetical protein